MQQVKCDYQLSKWQKEFEDCDSVIVTLKESNIPYKIKKSKKGFAVFRPKPTGLRKGF